MPPPGGCARGGGQRAGTQSPPGRSRHAVLKKIAKVRVVSTAHSCVCAAGLRAARMGEGVEGQRTGLEATVVALSSKIVILTLSRNEA